VLIISHIDVIFFDLDHTLVDTRRQYILGMPMALRELYGTDYPDDFVDHFLRHHDELWLEYDKRSISMDTLRIERFLRTWRDYEIHKQREEAERFQHVYDGTLEKTLFTFPGTLELLAQLASSYRLGIITNGAPDIQSRKMHITGLTQYFTPGQVTVSANVGKAKPDPSVYAWACEVMNTSPASSLMIGDNFAADYEGAMACGLSAIWYVPDPEMTDASPREGLAPLRTTSQVLQEIQRIIRC
jgi:HAD superfamily hydrolase (TIGR01549 family)